MKLTKDDLDEILGRECTLEQFNEILSWKEDAEKWREIVDVYKFVPEELIKHVEIVERLRKRLNELEEIGQELFNSGHSQSYEDDTIRELQEILGERR